MQFIILIVIIFILFSLHYYFKDKNTKKNDSKQELVAELDIATLSDTHYLLEAGKNQWRLSDQYYNNPKALIVYAIALISNNLIMDTNKKEELQSMAVRMRLSYLLYTYTDDKHEMQTKIQQLADRFSKRIHKIPKELQETYQLNNHINIYKKLKFLLEKG
jgi:predicted MPP superfamily phosphohydrolase